MHSPLRSSCKARSRNASSQPVDSQEDSKVVWILGMADEVIRAVRRAERISGVSRDDAGEFLILEMGIVGCGAIV